MSNNMNYKPNKKIIQTATACVLALVLIVVVSLYDDSSVAMAKKGRHHGGGGGGGTCTTTCGPYSATKDGITYSFTASSAGRCGGTFPSWGCELLRNEGISHLGPNSLSGSWGEGCGNVHSFNASIVARSAGSGGGGGGGCSTGQFYCELFRQCIPTNQVCNDANPEYKPFRINPNILANEGPVKLKSLLAAPPLGAPGYSCKIVWNNSFVSYDENTICTFTGPNNVSLSFSPASTTAPTSYQSPALQQDSIFKMSCSEGANTAVEKTETVCRLNINYVEVP